MHVIEVCDVDSGDVAYWELSDRVPRDADGAPVERGTLGRKGPFDREVIDEVDTFDVLLRTLKKRSDGRIRVTEVEQAFEAAESGAPSSDCRVRPRAAASTGGQVNYGRPAPAERPTPNKRFPVFSVLVVLGVLLALWWFFVR